ncbi:winged helix-turn-helix transcriptional regulator [Dyadobacter psychrotolerans]|uniref:Transcriptional regulator n=1 Tax=Dyadobacter psychrotolerans TaxID=2541721 RepID=A0A4R5E034_9BACT|nr:helix-turn-helix domain-containing protein [Dyadobacter psychrotolerans]TDE17085.1 transcriptional regulator [Dyadobacter psychrotolerans]
MYEKKIPVLLDCGLHLFMEVMNGKWKANLIWNIYSGIKRPGELQRKIPKATRRVLDTQLRQLTEHGILSKIVFNELPLKVEYELTALGETLIPAITFIAQWGEDHRFELEETIKVEISPVVLV